MGPASVVSLTRRAFLARLGGTAAAAAAATVLPELLRVRGWYHEASAQDPDVRIDTFNGLAAFVWPGDDAYSVAQGESTDVPGAVAAQAGRLIVEALDIFVPASDQPIPNDDTIPISGGIASVINAVALTVNPAGVGGAFPSPFARLAFADKAETWRRLEEETQQIDSSEAPAPFTNESGLLQFVFGVLPGFVQFFGLSETAFFDPETRTLTELPVGWAHSGYQDGRLVPVEGWDEFRGYWAGRQAAEG